jgi:hypothetical protein
MCAIVVVLLAIVATSLLVAASAAYNAVLLEVNSLRSPDQHIRAGDRVKTFYVLRCHANAFGESRKRRVVWLLGILGLAAFLAFFISTLACFATRV